MGILAISDFDLHIHFKDITSFLWLDRASSTKKKMRKATGMTPQFLDGTFGSFGLS